jgi:hypothetical protein
MGNKNNRFLNPEMASKNRIQPPTKVTYSLSLPYHRNIRADATIHNGTNSLENSPAVRFSPGERDCDQGATQYTAPHTRSVPIVLIFSMKWNCRLPLPTFRFELSYFGK